MEQGAQFELRRDGELLRLGRAGDEAAFLGLYQRRKEAVFRFALHMSGSRDVAEEVVQEVFLALLANDTRYDEKRGSVEAFLIGMARNQVRRQARSVGRLGRLECLEGSGEVQQSTESSWPATEVAALRQAILALPESYRAVMVLCEIEELNYAEAAEQLGCAVGTVRSRLHRARALLQKKLQRGKGCLTSTNNK